MLSLKFKTINPATEGIINEYENMTYEHLDNILTNAKKAFVLWKEDFKKRADYLHAFANEFRKNKDNLAKIATQEMGKPIRESKTEVEKCAWAMEYFADHGQIFMTDEIINTDARKSFITFEPLGVIASIMPWNFPYWQALRFAAPSLIAGNTIVLKPASATMQCGIEIEKTFDKAGLSEGIFKTVIGDSSVAEILVDSDVNAVTFTGSVPVGARVAQRATSQLKKTVLELGGSDPFIVCADADIEKASTGAVKGRFINCGQSCIASKRFIVVKNIANEFIEKFTQKTEKLKVGDPSYDDTDIGPLENAEVLSNIIKSGIVSVNNVVVSDPRVPFGGIKKSGFGRELSRYGMLEFVNIKSIRLYDQLIHEHYVE